MLVGNYLFFFFFVSDTAFGRLLFFGKSIARIIYACLRTGSYSSVVFEKLKNKNGKHRRKPAAAAVESLLTYIISCTRNVLGDNIGTRFLSTPGRRPTINLPTFVCGLVARARSSYNACGRIALSRRISYYL